MGLYFEAKGKDDGDDDYSGRVKTPKKTPKKSKAATPKRGKGGKVENRGRPAKSETPAKKSPAKKSKSPAKKTKTPKKETPKKAPAKKEPPKVGDKNVILHSFLPLAVFRPITVKILFFILKTLARKSPLVRNEM